VGRKSMTGGVAPAGRDRIQFTFKFEGVRYRPTLPIVPSEANLRKARQQLARIRQGIANGTFSFAEEFPDFRHLERAPSEGSPRTFNEVFDAFLAHCRSRLENNDLAHVTVATYRRMLNGAWRPFIGRTRFLNIRCSTLVEVVDRARWSYEISKAASAKHETPDGAQSFIGEYACGAARNVCRDGYSALCDSYRKDFQRAGRTCFGVTDSNP
jgi:hypothetical protein